jgi:hypothetical protein
VNADPPVAGLRPYRDANADLAATRTLKWTIATAIVGAVLALAIIYLLPSLLI